MLKHNFTSLDGFNGWLMQREIKGQSFTSHTAYCDRKSRNLLIVNGEDLSITRIPCPAYTDHTMNSRVLLSSCDSVDANYALHVFQRLPECKTWLWFRKIGGSQEFLVKTASAWWEHYLSDKVLTNLISWRALWWIRNNCKGLGVVARIMILSHWPLRSN